MTHPPPYFEKIRAAAARRWDQLESDPELAAPWHQLFKQVQSPRHVLSELLQNADDAKATEASAEIKDGCLLFSHNGEDFTEEHFTSLCRFGYSNKRALHTIGFRGVGFKSTFSLGPRVELYTPTLSVAFLAKRFTEPLWAKRLIGDARKTWIRVPIADKYRAQELENNLHEWMKTPVSLLFFKHIRSMTIGTKTVCWQALGPGPVSNSEWVSRDPSNADKRRLLARSATEPFPEEALAEIRQERLIGVDQGMEFPPCRVEIVSGAPGRLYVVLPTGVKTTLSFACNAPFIQDPARLKIKDPGTSPTNRWLLERIGRLAASVMLRWLRDDNQSVADRSSSYTIVPDLIEEDGSLECTSASIVATAFFAALDGEQFLLTNGGELKAANESIVVPEALLDVWPGSEVTTLFDGRRRPPFSRHVPTAERAKLQRHRVIQELSWNEVLGVLRSQHLPKPKTSMRLLKLWAYVAPGYDPEVEGVRIVPVEGQNVLYSAEEVVRLGEKRILQSNDDWAFLARHLRVLDHDWQRFLADRVSNKIEGEHDKELEEALEVLDSLGLKVATDVSRVIERVASDFFGRPVIDQAECIRLAQIAAKLDADVSGCFKYLTRDGWRRSPEEVLLVDTDGTLEALIPASWRSGHLLKAEYHESFTSCTTDEWRRWASSRRSGLRTFAPLRVNNIQTWDREKFESALRARGLRGSVSYTYKNPSFLIEDWDFEELHWRHWIALAKDDPKLWFHVFARMLVQPTEFWSEAMSARAVQVSASGRRAAVTYEPLTPTWVLMLRELPCLPDTRNVPHKPSELLRRTSVTEPFLDVEPFVHSVLDIEQMRPLLALLGVRHVPTGPGRILDCLRALAKSDAPPVAEVDKWYRRLDQLIETCSTGDLDAIREAFRTERVILTANSGWAAAPGVFLMSDEEDVPGAAVVRSSVHDLAIWRKLGIAERPTADLAITWLQKLPSSVALDPNDSRRVRALIGRHSHRVWAECGHWITLAGEWTPTSALSYALTRDSLIPLAHLYKWVKQKTADFQVLPPAVLAAHPFSEIPTLAGQVEDRFLDDLVREGPAENKPWLTALGTELQRIELDDEAKALRIRGLASRLANTAWQQSPGLETTPYIAGTPAGTSRRADVLWLDTTLYVDVLPRAKLAKRVPEEIGKLFNRPDIKAALDYGFERSAADVQAYLQENFTLGAPVEAQPAANPTVVESPPPPAPVPSTVNATPPEMEREAEAQCAAARSSPPPGPPAEAALTVEGPAIRVERTPEAQLGGAPVATPIKEPKPPKLTMIERFARKNGFRKDNDNRYFHPDGSWIAKSNGEVFPWEHCAATGGLMIRYWPKDHCLEREALEVPADVWALIEKHPVTCAFILADSEGEPIAITGAELGSMRTQGALTLYPATYRLVVEHGVRAYVQEEK